MSCVYVHIVHLKEPLSDKTVFIIWKGNILTFLNPLFKLQMWEGGAYEGTIAKEP